MIGNLVAAVLKSEIHFGTNLSCRILDDGKKYWAIINNNRFQEEVDAIELSRHQDLYYKEESNHIVEQQKQKTRATLDGDNNNDIVIEIENIYVGT